MCESLREYVWLYRGVPAESPEVADVEANREVYPRRPGYVGEYARYCHSVNEMTDTGYTSWTTDRYVAEELARFASMEANLGGELVIFRVRINTIEESRITEGLDSECEYLIEGTVENIEFSEDPNDERDD